MIDPQPMYNFTVDVAHTYFVGDGEWLVHNDCKAYANTANMALHQLDDDLRAVTIAVSMNDDGSILAVYGRTSEITNEAIIQLREKGWNVFDAPSIRTPEFHAERQLYAEGYTQIGISRQAGMCSSCQQIFDSQPNATVVSYTPR